MRQKMFTRLSELLVWVIVLAGLLTQLFALPQVSESLSEQYQEYSRDKFFIQTLLTLIVFIGQISLGFIILLLRKVRHQKLLSEGTLKWVKALATSLAAVAGAFGVLICWLMSKNTLPPSLAAVLLLAILLSATMALITLALKGVLQSAIETHLELDGVI
ncbi:MAG: hypothetical protein RL196_715 [Actinomycetota bacterium]|jgi:NAD/NADP transhydrogenase beta subunit